MSETLTSRQTLDPAAVAHMADRLPRLIGDLRSDHAGETGAVWIYRGILSVSRDQAVRRFASEHLATEQDHLTRLQRILPARQASLLLPIWRVAGFLTGFMPALVGPRAVYATIDAVETFVDKHYEEQLHALPHDGPGSALRALLMECQADEVRHRDEARDLRAMSNAGPFTRAWQWLVGTGSALAVSAARRI